MHKIKRIGLLIRTIRYLKPIQILNRIQRKLITPKVDQTDAPSLRAIDSISFDAISRGQSFVGHNEFSFLNRAEVINFPDDWNKPTLPKLWLYNLHYFEGLLNSDTETSLKYQIINQWIVDTPPAYGNGWEPYPNSLRICNWIKFHLMGHPLDKDMIHSLAIQIRYLMQTLEYHLLGNHLYANAKALILAGCFFEGKEADLWYDKGMKILDKQIPEQFLNDGAHFELSATYHALLTEDLLDMLQIMKLAYKTPPPYWGEVIQKALNWLTVMTRPDGLPPLFNDAAYGITPEYKDIITLAHSLGYETEVFHQGNVIDMTESGYFRFDGDHYSYFGDAGQIGPGYLPGHAHCDMLNFELFAHGNPIIVDTGISTYDTNKRRHIERNTSSHNVVQVNNLEQSEIWGAFRVARRARIIERHIQNNSIQAAYQNYSQSYQHSRKINFLRTEMTMTDQITSNLPSFKAVSRYHFHPDINISVKDNIIQAGPLTMKIENALDIQIKTYDYAPEFNRLVPAQMLEIEFKSPLIVRIYP